MVTSSTLILILDLILPKYQEKYEGNIYEDIHDICYYLSNLY